MATERVKLLDPVTEAAEAKVIAARYRCDVPLQPDEEKTITYAAHYTW